MIKILFVCLGNICRSPMAEYILKDMVKKKGLSNKFIINSAGTSAEEQGNEMDYRAKRKLTEMGIEYSHHIARQLKKEDYEDYDYIIGMDDSNISNILRIVEKDEQHKIYKLLDFTKKTNNIADPWYTGNFDKTYNDIKESCKALLNTLLTK